MDELTWLQQGESMLRHTSSLKGVLIVATEIFRLRHRNKLNREKIGRDTTSKSRQKIQYKCKEVMSRHEDRLKADKLCHDKKN